MRGPEPHGQASAPATAPPPPFFSHACPPARPFLTQLKVVCINGGLAGLWAMDRTGSTCSGTPCPILSRYLWQREVGGGGGGGHLPGSCTQL